MAKRYEKAREYTLKYRGQLRPCFFCGNKELDVYSDRSTFPSRDVWGISCSKCGDCVRPDTSVRRVVEYWNDRVDRLRLERKEKRERNKRRKRGAAA